MIDIHTHLLPDVDDGSPSYAVSVDVLVEFAVQGVRQVVCTPHLNASQVDSAPYREHVTILEELQRLTPPGVTLHLGWEIMLDEPGVDLTAPELTLGNSRALLVEFTRGGVPRTATSEMRRIARSGRIPILAHPERYFGCTIDHVRGWREVGVIIQTDVSVLLSRGAPADLARTMLAEGLIDVLASDNHGDGRTLAAGHAWLVEQGLEEHANLLTRVNAERVLGDEDPLPVPPIRTGIGDRLRRLFGR
jgi:protein-tyrosine phosphatase